MRIASLISGGGTTMEQIGLACKRGDINGELALVIASKDKAEGRVRAKNIGIPSIITIDPKLIPVADVIERRKIFGERLMETLIEHRIDIVLQNGWMPLTPESVILGYQGRIFNQHPGPPEDFGGKGMFGKRVHAAVLHFRRKMMEEGLVTKEDCWTEVVAQRVHPVFDEGFVVEADRIGFSPDSTVVDLQAKCLPHEHDVQIRLLKNIVSGNIREHPKQHVATTDRAREILAESKRIAIAEFPEG